MSIPKMLEDRLRAGKVIPFIGAGVSMAVLGRDNNPIYPSWKELLLRSAARLDQEVNSSVAGLVRILLEQRPPEYLEAAERARNGLGAVWYDFLKLQFAISREQVEDESLTLARLMWQLGSRLLITTNYDRVLHWACPNPDDLDTWDIEAPAEQSAALREGLKNPTIWHLHGQIGNAANLILTPDGYTQLYRDSTGPGDYHEAALQTLRALLSAYTFLFIGFSLDDAYFGLQLRGIDRIFQGGTGPHYVLVSEASRERVRELGLPVDIITFSDYGEPLLDCVRALVSIAAQNEEWLGIENELSQLLSDQSNALFSPLIEDLLQWIKGQPPVFTLEIYLTFIHLIRKMSSDVAEGHPIQDVLRSASSSEYSLPDEQANEVLRREAHVFKNVLNKFDEKIRPTEPESGVYIPIVLVVMYSDEARQLLSGAAFEGYPEILQTSFERLCEVLAANGLDDWEARYGETAETWRPFNSAQHQDTIEQLIRTAFGNIQGFMQPIIPKFIDIHKLNLEENRRSLRGLRRDGCVVIMDSISMHHPDVHRAFQQSALDSRSRTAIVSMAPVQSAFELINKMTVFIQLKISDMEFARRRLDQDEEYGISREIYEIREFSQWVADRARKMYPSEENKGTGIRAHMFKLAREIR